MVLKGNTGLLVLLLCSLTLWCKTTSAGSSFLSPSHKPPNRGKPPRVNRQVKEEPTQSTKGYPITVSAPFDMGITMTAEDFEAFSVLLQDIAQRLLGDTDTGAERPSYNHEDQEI